MVTLAVLECRMQIEEWVLAELRQRKPARLLAEGARAEALARRHLDTHPDCALAASGTQAELAFAFVDGAATKAEALALIGRMKQQAPVVLVAAREDSPLAFNDFLSFGMQRLADADGDALFLFDLHSYKPAPDWLNSRYWANPERWKP